MVYWVPGIIVWQESGVYANFWWVHTKRDMLRGIKLASQNRSGHERAATIPLQKSQGLSLRHPKKKVIAVSKDQGRHH